MKNANINMAGWHLFLLPEAFVNVPTKYFCTHPKGLGHFTLLCNDELSTVNNLYFEFIF